MVKGLGKKSMKPSLWKERENRREGQGHLLGYREGGIGESITVKHWNYALLTPLPLPPHPRHLSFLLVDSGASITRALD